MPEAYRLSAIAPNATLIGQIMDRLFGQARQSIDLDVSTEPSRLSDIELTASITGLLEKLSPPALPPVVPLSGGALTTGTTGTTDETRTDTVEISPDSDPPEPNG